MKCYKCGGKVALINTVINLKESWYCLPYIYEINRDYGKRIMPFTKLELDKIREGKKTTSLRSAIPKYSKYPFELTRVYITEEFIIDDCGKITDEVVESEGFETFDELITALKKKGHRLPKEFWLYDLNKPII